LIAGNYYGSPTDIYGTDPRACGQNEASAVDGNGNALAIPAADAGYCDFLTAQPSPFTQSGDLAIPNPYTGKMDGMGQFQNPWQLNIGALIHYDISPKISANLSLTNIVNTCFGGSSTPWSKQFKPNNYVCGYGDYSGGYLGAMKGQPGFGGGFYYGDSPASAANASPAYATAMNYPFAPLSGALPFQAYLDVQIKL
jgi:hypothetical protein